MKKSSAVKSLALSLTLGMGLAVTSAWAQDDLTRRDMRNFHEFLESHPRIAQDLRNDPALANDRRWVSKHDDLEAFLRDNPRIRQELRENPRRTLNSERNYASNINPSDVRKMDRFLDSHPRIAERLRANPELINDRKFVDDHNELQAFLRDNPEIRRDFQSRPRAFMERVERNRVSQR